MEHIEPNSGRRIGSLTIDLGKLTGRKPTFRRGQIVYGYLRPYLNKVWIADFDGCSSVDQFAFDVRQDLADTHFIAAFMRSETFLRRSEVVTTTGQLPRISIDEIAAVSIELPPVEQQRRIAADLLGRLDAAESVIARSREQLGAAEALPAALLRAISMGSPRTVARSQRRTATRRTTGGKQFATQQSVDLAIKSICDIMRRGNVASALQYVPELTWILFLRILDETEEREELEADAVGASYTPSLKKPYRWKDWAAPLESATAKPNKRNELDESSAKAFKKFVNEELIPYLKGLKDKPNADAAPEGHLRDHVRRRATRIDTETNLLDVLDKVHEITNEGIDPTHVFTLSQVYEGLLLKMGEKGSDAGQFFTPREVIRAMVRAVEPKIGETVYDPCCGTGGFLAQAAEYMQPKIGAKISGPAVDALQARDVLGPREGEPHLPDRAGEPDPARHRPAEHLARQHAHGRRGLRRAVRGSARPQFDVILTNPPFGGKEGKEAQTNFDYRTGATQVLFLQHVIRALEAEAAAAAW